MAEIIFQKSSLEFRRKFAFGFTHSNLKTDDLFVCSLFSNEPLEGSVAIILRLYVKAFRNFF